jgi:hypothetical protein
MLQLFVGQRERASELLRDALALARSCERHGIGNQCLELARQHAVRLVGAQRERPSRPS